MNDISYPNADAGPDDGPAYEFVVQRAIEDATTAGHLDIKRFTDWIRHQIWEVQNDDENPPTYCPDCDGHVRAFPTQLTEEDRRRHRALAAFETRLGRKVTDAWFEEARGFVSVEVLLAAIKVAAGPVRLDPVQIKRAAVEFERISKDLGLAAQRAQALQDLIDPKEETA